MAAGSQVRCAVGVPLPARGGMGRRRLLSGAESGRGARRSRLPAWMTAAAAGVRSTDEDDAGIDEGCRTRAPGSIHAVGSWGSASAARETGVSRPPRGRRAVDFDERKRRPRLILGN